MSASFDAAEIGAGRLDVAGFDAAGLDAAGPRGWGASGLEQARVDVVPLRPPKGMQHPRFGAIMLGVGSVLAGFMVFGVMMVVDLMLGFWGEHINHATTVGLIVGVSGIAAAIVTYKPQDAKPRIVVSNATAQIFMAGYREPLVVTRANVRFVTTDATPLKMFRKNPRFPILGAVPHALFADALDRFPGNPMDFTNPTLPGRWQPPIGDIFPTSGGESRSKMPQWLEALSRANRADSGLDATPNPSPYPTPYRGAGPLDRTPDDGAPVDREPQEHEPGWVNSGSRGPQVEPAVHGHLFSGDGSALPVLRNNPLDLPNVAILFSHPTLMPKRRPDLNPLVCKLPFTKSKQIGGLMCAVVDLDQVEAAFGRWGVVRQPTVDDVIDKGLRPPKPIKGLRAIAFAATIIVPIILGQILRTRF